MYLMSRELGDQFGADAGFFADFAQGGLLGRLAGIDGALGQRDQFGVGWGALGLRQPDVPAGAVHVRLDDRHIPAAAHFA